MRLSDPRAAFLLYFVFNNSQQWSIEIIAHRIDSCCEEGLVNDYAALVFDNFFFPVTTEGKRLDL